MSLELNYDLRFNQALGAILNTPEIAINLDYPSVVSELRLEKPILPSGAIKYADLFKIQHKYRNYLLEVVPDLFQIYDDGREAIENKFLNISPSLVESGVVTIWELAELFKCCSKWWSEQWVEAEFNYRTRIIFEPCNYTSRSPYEKQVSLEAAYSLAQDCRNSGKRVVTVMGNFDFHGGHAEFIETARELAGKGLVIACVTTDEEANATRKRDMIENQHSRLQSVSCHYGVDYCVLLPWENEYRKQKVFIPHMKELHRNLGAHFRLVGELDERKDLITEQCELAGTKLVYVNEERVRGVSSTDYRAKLFQSF